MLAAIFGLLSCLLRGLETRVVHCLTGLERANRLYLEQVAIALFLIMSLYLDMGCPY